MTDGRAPDAELEVVVVSYDCRALVSACLESLESVRDEVPGMRVHLVDNASHDGTPDAIRERFPDVAVHALGDNVGFSAANNVVLARAAAPFVLLLNPDTEVHPGALPHLLDEMRANPRIGMIGCRLVQPNGEFDHAAKRSFPTPTSALAHFLRVGRVASAPAALAQYRAPELGEHEVGDVDAVNGAFMLVRREALEAVGPLDPGYWLYMEDLDWCYRFHEAGWRVVYDGRVSVLHHKGGSSGIARAPRQNIAFHRGMARFYRKFYAGRRRGVDALVYAGIAAKLAVSLVAAAVARRLPARA